MANMKISAAGIKAIEQREGTRLKAYPDDRGIPTIGTGHTGPEVHLGLVWTQEQSDAALAKDLAWAEAAVNDSVKVQITQNEFDALVSLAYNIGAAGIKGSSVVRQLNAGNVQIAADDFMMWDKPAELVSRRISEQKQFLSRIPVLTTDLDPPVTPPILPNLSTWAGVRSALTLLGFGTVYSTALPSFQRWAGLRADGIYGAQTLVALEKALASLSKKTGVTT